MIQLDSRRLDAGLRRLDETRSRSATASMRGGAAAWGSSKLEVVDGTPPRGARRRRLTRQLLRRGALSRQLRLAGRRLRRYERTEFDSDTVVRTIPTDPAQARALFPWIKFQGRWGELQPAFYNGPTGPNLKLQWTEPIRWSRDWRSRSYAVPAAVCSGRV